MSESANIVQGMMVLKPDEPTFGELIGLAKEGKSFDGRWIFLLFSAKKF